MVPLKNTFWKLKESEDPWYYKYVGEGPVHNVINHKGTGGVVFPKEWGELVIQVTDQEELGMVALMFVDVVDLFKYR